MNDLYDKTQECAAALRRISSVKPQVAMILGTGLGAVADSIEVEASIPFEEARHFPNSAVESHHGNLVFGRLSGCNVVAMQGRFHYYEGHSLETVTLPVRVFRELGAETLVINSAAGGLNPGFDASDVMLVTDHINFMGANPLRGVVDDRLGDVFPDMSRPYDRALAELAAQTALDLGITLRSGVYVAVSGPSLETPAETRMLRLLGADAVGMSTVPEVIIANQVGLKVLAVAAITNVNIPKAMEPISIERVIANAAVAEPKLTALLREIMHRLSQTCK